VLAVYSGEAGGSNPGAPVASCVQGYSSPEGPGFNFEMVVGNSNLKIILFSASFLCNFDLTYYPFDVQTCEIQLVLTEHQKEQARYIYFILD
jgi:hypothetical protein